MSPRQTQTEPNRAPPPAMGLSFAFPMRLPENGTGAGSMDRPAAKTPARSAEPRQAKASQ